VQTKKKLKIYVSNSNKNNPNLQGKKLNGTSRRANKKFVNSAIASAFIWYIA
jgi:hypothetical protein